MKRARFIVIAALLISLMCAACAAGFCASAETAEQDGHTAEYSAGGIYIPILRTEAGQSYKAEVFAEEDTEYQQPIAVEDNVLFYPESLGTFRIRYLVSDNGVDSYVYDRITVQDTSVPVISLEVQQEYAVGDTVSFVPSVSDNTAQWATVTYQMMKDGVLCSDKISSGSAVIDSAGQYRVMVTVTDAGGNRAWTTADFTVPGGAGGGNTGLIIGLSVGGGVLVLAAAAVAVVLVIRKKKAAENAEGGNDGEQG